MPFPRKFQSLLEIERGDVTIPDYVWLVYAVCAVTKDSCGWGGWMVESAFQNDGGQSTSTGDILLPTMDEQRCPICGRETFRTGASVRMAPTQDQRLPRKPGVDYAVAPIEYDE
ncbi:hypothetical protein CCAX7_27830 [Capsulimonas corticalis]|uniref:Uncharacterized protein n=1 Tax=Capsulimonas corticalis TaxID=2219043 RepID=A0A402CTI2_9BACT|nr:hypothetical protein [Capsulimonas corticalis]BDI30732.1 hypothetical protein CCAX7_27830 [Capsulimonas corticalis]